MQVYHGSYVGNGTSLAVTDPGFKPDLLLTKRIVNGVNYAVWATSAMASGSNAYRAGDAGAPTTGFVTSFDVNGFTLGSSDYSNASGSTYYYMVIRDNGAKDFKVGTEVGTGADGNPVTGLGFSPAYLAVKPNTANWDFFTFSSATMANKAFRYNGGTLENIDDIFASLDADGFTLNFPASGEFNQNGVNQYWWAIKAVPGKVAVQEWTGDGADSRNISLTDSLITPVFASVKADNTENAVVRFKQDTGDQSHTYIFGETYADLIQSFGAGTFQVGADNRINQNTKKFDGLFIADNFNEPAAVLPNNYKFGRADSGMSCSEKIR